MIVNNHLMICLELAIIVLLRNKTKILLNYRLKDNRVLMHR